MNKGRKVVNILYNQPLGTGVKGRPKNLWIDCVLSHIKMQDYELEEQSRDRGIWKKSIMEVKASIGL